MAKGLRCANEHLIGDIREVHGAGKIQVFGGSTKDTRVCIEWMEPRTSTRRFESGVGREKSSLLPLRRAL
jgi:hypothetical protein